MAYHHDVSILIPVWIVLFSIANGEPLTEVILKHGGKLRGLRTSFHNTPVNLFLGRVFSKQCSVNEFCYTLYAI